MGFIAMVAFWMGVTKLWIADGARTPIKFIIAWVIGFFAIPALGLHPALSQTYVAILAIAVWLTVKFRS